MFFLPTFLGFNKYVIDFISWDSEKLVLDITIGQVIQYSSLHSQFSDPETDIL